MRVRNVIVLVLAAATGAASQVAASALSLDGLSANAIVWGAAVLFALIAVPLSLGLGDRTADRPAHRKR